MIKRQESSSAAPSSIPPPSVAPDAGLDRNGKDKKYQRHGTALEFLRRWIARRGQLAVLVVVAALLSVFLIPPLKVLWNGGASGRIIKAARRLQVPPCPRAPWKEGEDLRGKCPGDLKPFGEAATISQCASTCCANEECISWQFREDVGCLQGKDIRLGMEKDGPSAWCSEHPPQRWHGQYLQHHGKAKEEGAEAEERRQKACSEATWNPDEEVGQCFGLGDVKKDASGSAVECMRACCTNEKCKAWQWNEKLGCFYGGGMHGCQGEGDPIAFAPFVGRRKRLESRKYTDKHNRPWQMAL
ncbi:hypothetical protein ACHAXT_011292 [Thalassiosira profunda]